MTDLYQSSITFSSADDTAASATSSLPANQVHAELRRLADSNFAQGKLFERVMCRYFMQAPLYQGRFKTVMLWGDWAHEHGIDARDVGIDLVAETRNGEYWAIQCKCYAENLLLQKPDINSFLASTGNLWGEECIAFTEAVIVSTTPRWSVHAEGAIKNRTPSCLRLDLNDLIADEGVDWSALLPDLDLDKTPPRQLRPHQQAAVDDVILGFSEADRGQLIMACGTGKTYTSLKIAERQAGAGGRVLFLVPSLSLLSQTLREWAAHHEWAGISTFAVCSDTKVGRTNEDINAYDMAIPPTTDGHRLADGLLSDLPAGHVQLVFATYHSIAVMRDAQQRGAPAFDLVICDEAHRTTGVDLKDQEASYYTKVHDNDYLKADKRLYMTATPRIYKDSAKQRAREQDQVAEIYSMDDAAKYGDTFHRLDFSDAVAMDLLSDYKVLVLMVNQGHANASVQSLLAMMEKTNLNDAAKIIGCWNGLSKRIAEEESLPQTDMAPMRRAVAFCQSIDASKNVVEKSFSDIVQSYRESYPDDETALDCTVQHVDGTQNALKRNQALQWLRDEPGENECRILSNVRCLSEGVDVPALDAVLFLSPRNSQVDVVQAVGRVMRKAQGKEYGYVILPVCVDEDKSPEAALQDDKTYKVVWQVLQALRAHDNRFNAEINRIELNKRQQGKINIIGVGFGGPTDDDDTTGEPEPSLSTIQLPINLKDWKEALYARLVLKCGDRRYWETWAKDVAEIAGRNITRITTLVDESQPDYRLLFDEFLTALRQNINPQVSEADAIEMLAQHLITRPVFDALFEGYSFIGSNPVSKTMQAILELLDEQKLETETKSLQGFYDSVRRRASGIDNAEGRQKVVIELYEKFFKEAFPKMAESLGIVYTPVEIVDFILHSVNDLLVQEFGESLSSENVHVLDPFTGTGTFLTRMLASGLIDDAALQRKYRQELHANEIVLLAYYIAAVNIEETYHERLQAKRLIGGNGADANVKYESFPGIVLTDTFQINERDGDMLNQIFPINSERVMRQKDTPIRVVLGNPPYSAKQRSANDDNANLRYPRLDKNIAGGYAKYSKANNLNVLYDSYIRAFRWASDRIGEEGIVAYVSNGGWLDGSAMDGFRRCLAEEFSHIYCFNLRGNQRTSGEISRREGGKIFGSGSRAGIMLTFLVKKKDAQGECQIRYRDIGDYLDRKQKLDTIRGFGSIGNIESLWETITPNKYNDWINQRNEAFLNYLPLGDKDNKRHSKSVPSVFTLYSLGVATGRDVWAYNFSKTDLAENMKKTIEFFNGEAERYQKACKENNDAKKPDTRSFVNYDSTNISWGNLIDQVTKKDALRFIPNNQRNSIYRPYCKQWLYFDQQLNARRYQQHNIFPSPDRENLAICVSGISSSRSFCTLMVDMVSDLNCLDAGTQCFPRYRYLPSDGQGMQAALAMGETTHNRMDNIPQETVVRFQEKYGDAGIDGDAVFYYVYGLLHSPDYKTRFSADLKKMLPRIPLFGTIKDFQAFSDAGRELAELHVGYEAVEGWPLTIAVEEKEQAGQGAPDDNDLYRVKKMRFGGAARSPDKTTIKYNDYITVEGIPLDTYKYIVNGKSAIEWVIERYQVSQHKDSKLINDPNDWTNDPRYILELLGKVVTVSMKTMEIVKQLPKLESHS